MNTLLLDRDPWDLCQNALGNIAVAAAPYATVQDVASAVRLFVGELYYGPALKGVPYRTDALGQPFPTALFKAKIVSAALAVPGVTGAQVFLTQIVNRAIGGQIQIQTAAGPQVVTF